MYTAPELYQTENKLVDVDIPDIEVCIEECVFKDGNPCSDSTVMELCFDHMAENDLDIPSDTDEAVQLYHFLRGAIYQDLHV